MNVKMAALTVVIITAGIFTLTRTKKHTLSDFGDAIADVSNIAVPKVTAPEATQPDYIKEAFPLKILGL